MSLRHLRVSRRRARVLRDRSAYLRGRGGRNTASAALGLAAVNTAGYLGFLSGPAVIGFTANTFGLREALFLVVFLSLLVASLAQVVHIPEGAHAAREEEPVLQ